MLTSLLDGVMERRARQLIELVRGWVPTHGRVLDLGSGTGHVASRLDQQHGIDVVTADVTDIHVVGRPPLAVSDGVLPFEDDTFSAALLFFMLAYPSEPASVLAEAARVTRGPVIVIQSLHANRFGYAWLRVREFVWTVLAFQLSRLVGYVSPDATFTMNTQRFYTAESLGREVEAAGLRIRAQRVLPVLPDRSLVVAAWLLERKSARSADLRATADRCDA